MSRFSTPDLVSSTSSSDPMAISPGPLKRGRSKRLAELHAPGYRSRQPVPKQPRDSAKLDEGMTDPAPRPGLSLRGVCV